MGESPPRRGRDPSGTLVAHFAGHVSALELAGQTSNRPNEFVTVYNEHRPHRSLDHRATPATAYQARPKASPGHLNVNPHQRVRQDRVDTAGSVTLRINGRLHHIGIGRVHAATRILLLVHDLDIRVLNAATGEIIRDLTLDPTRITRAPAHPKDQPDPKTGNEPTLEVRPVRYLSRDHTRWRGRDRTCNLLIQSSFKAVLDDCG